MQFIDLKAQQDIIRPEIERRIQTVLDHGQYIMGPEVRELEERLADYVGVKHCLSCSSGTDALLLALMANNIGPGDAVFTSPFTFIATAEVIALLGATPVFVDIDPMTFNIDPVQLDLAIQAVFENNPSLHPLPRQENIKNAKQLKPKCIIPVDLFGLPCDFNLINEIVATYNKERATFAEQKIIVIEDAAQSLGAEYKGKRAGALSDIGCTSFFPAKPLGCYGDGGAIFTNKDNVAEMIRSIRVHGTGTHKYDNARIGINGRLDTLQAAILLAKMDIFPHEIKLRQQHAKYYQQLLAPCLTLTAPSDIESYSSAWAQFSLLAKDSKHKQKLQIRLNEQGIPSAIYYPIPLHQQKAFAYLGYRESDFQVADDCASRIFRIPIHPYLRNDIQENICEILSSE